MTSHYDRFKAFYQTSSFWSGKLAGIQQFSLSNFNFKHLSEAEESLELPAIPIDTVLGKRAEYFFKFCVEQSSNYQLLAANEQIFSGKNTIGELDFILQHLDSGKNIHVELVYKFYIYEPHTHKASRFLSHNQNKELSFYVGPNRRDYFIKKFEHLAAHQLPLLYRPETQERLDQLGINALGMEQQVCFLAHVFIPRQAWQQDFPFLNKKCIVGYYMDESAFAKAYTDNLYFLPEKKEWKMRPQRLERAYTHRKILEHSRSSLQRGFAPMVWMLLQDGSFERFFIVSPVKV